MSLFTRVECPYNTPLLLYFVYVGTLIHFKNRNTDRVPLVCHLLLLLLVLLLSFHSLLDCERSRQD